MGDLLDQVHAEGGDLLDQVHASDPKFVSNVTESAPRSLGSKILHAPLDAVEGIGSGVISTGLGAYKLLRKIPGAAGVLPAPSATFEGAAQPPDTFAGHAGKFVEQGAEFLVPVGEVGAAFKAAEVARAARAAETGIQAAKFIPTVARLGAEAGAAGATTGVQTGGDVPAMAVSAGTAGILGAAGAVIPAVGIPAVRRLVESAPRPLSEGVQALAAKLGVPLTRGMVGGSKAVQAAEKMLGHTVAPDLYEPLLEQAQQGINAGARDVSGGFATDRYSAGEGAVRTMLNSAGEFESQAQKEYANLAKFEKDPANARSVPVGTRQNASLDPTAPDRVPDMQTIGLPVDMRPAKQILAPEVEEISRRMTDAQKRSDPGLAAIKNIITRPDHLPASVAEADLSYLKEILRSDASGQAKRLAAKAIDAMEPEVQSAVAQAGPGATAALNDARGAWQARSSILDLVKELSGDASGKTGQVRLANRLLQPADASYPALAKVLEEAPAAAPELGKAYLTDRVFKDVADGADLTTPKQAQNLWNQIGPRTKAALYSPEQIQDVNNFLDLAKRVAENPNPSGTGTLNALIKMGAMVMHPVAGGASLVFGRGLAKVLYSPEGAATIRTALAGDASPAAEKAALAIRAILNETETARAGQAK